MSQKQLLLSGQARASDLLAMGVVEAQERQDGVCQPQHCDTPEGGLCTGEFSVERRGVNIQVHGHRLGLYTAIWTPVVVGDGVTPGEQAQTEGDACPAGQKQHTQTQ